MCFSNVYVYTFVLNVPVSKIKTNITLNMMFAIKSYFMSNPGRLADRVLVVTTFFYKLVNLKHFISLYAKAKSLVTMTFSGTSVVS